MIWMDHHGWSSPVLDFATQGARVGLSTTMQRMPCRPGLETDSDVSGSTLVPVMPPRVPVINHRSSISYRKIRPSDLEVLQEMHEALFPIKYESEFFMNVIHGRGIISWAAVDTSRSDARCDEIIGFVTVRVITPSQDEHRLYFGR